MVAGSGNFIKRWDPLGDPDTGGDWARGGGGGGGGGGANGRANVAPDAAQQNQNAAPARRYKHIILGIDGTWQAAYSDLFQSNVHRLNIALNFQDVSKQNPQIFIYSAGVGTANRSSRTFAGATGDGLDELVLEAYINLVSNYVPGDKIYIFGFSRGAIAARALTSFISYSGLLKPNSTSMIEDAWRYFTGAPARTNFAANSGHTHAGVKIKFLGVWDSVPGPFGRKVLEKRYRFRTLKLDNSVQHGVHILSMDETRKSFLPLMWEGRANDQQTMEQIWLPGVHTDIGGGYSDSFLSTVSLLLMIDRLMHYCPELEFDTDYIESALLRVLRTEEVVVNNEWPKWSRILRRFRTARRTASTEPAHNHSKHPLADLIQHQRVKIRGKRIRYAPSFEIRGEGALPLFEDFSDQSWHKRHLTEILNGYLQRTGFAAPRRSP